MIELVSIDGRYVRVVVNTNGSYGSNQARDIAHEIAQAASLAERIPAIHERHVNLQRSCPLCVFEAHGQLDRLEGEEDA